MLPQIMPLSWFLILLMLFFSYYTFLIFTSTIVLNLKSDFKTAYYSFKNFTW